jgi:hypothetical protein
MRAKSLAVIAMGALATVALAQSQNTSVPTQSEAQKQSLQSRGTFVPYGYRVESAYLQTPYSSRCRD